MVVYVLKRVRRFLKRRWNYLLNALRKRQNNAELSQPRDLQPGDIVRVRSRQEISGTLDNWNRSGGCQFLEEMCRYCGTVQTVRKRVRQFLDERDYRVKKCLGIVILEGITCEGTKDFGDCDRSCFFFWREEWLEKIGPESPVSDMTGPGRNEKRTVRRD
jgi:hypothetical protein